MGVCFKVEHTYFRLSEIHNKIIFGTQGAGVKFYSEDTNGVRDFINNTNDVEGVAWDDKHKHVYYSFGSKLSRAKADGTEAQVVFENTACEFCTVVPDLPHAALVT